MTPDVLDSIETDARTRHPYVEPGAVVAFPPDERDPSRLTLIAGLRAALTRPELPAHALHRACERIRAAFERLVRAHAPDVAVEVLLVDGRALPDVESPILRRAACRKARRAGRLELVRDGHGLAVGARYRFAPDVAVTSIRPVEMQSAERRVQLEPHEERLFVHLVLSRMRQGVGAADQDGKAWVTAAIEEALARLKRSPADLELPAPLELGDLLERDAEDLDAVFAFFRRLRDEGVIHECFDRGGASPRTAAGTFLLRPGSDRLFFVFTGGAPVDVLQMPPSAFLAEGGLADQNVVFLRDRSGEFYTRGLSPEISGMAGLLGYQRGILAAHPEISHAYAIGTSLGAFGALLTGHHLALEEVWVFGLPEVAFGGTDLRELLATPNGVTRYHLYFSEGYALDREIAVQFEGLAGVELHPVPGDDHFVAQELWRQGRLRDLFPQRDPATHTPSAAPAAREFRPLAREALARFLSRELRVDVTSLQDDAPLFSTGLVDSFDMVALVGFLEQECGLTMPPADVHLDHLDSITRILGYAARRGAPAR